jgi:hypothetical protein
MQSGASGRTFGAPPGIACRAVRAHRRAVCAAFALSLSVLTLGCTTGGGPLASAFSGRAGAVAFDTIDGPPAAVFRKFVQRLDEEAQARQIAVVPHDSPAQYRIRSYLSANVHRGQASIAWVWDVYDAQERRRLRIAGEESAGRAGRNAWATADDAVLRRIAQNGMERLAAFLAAPGPEPAPAGGEITVALAPPF